MAEVGGWLNLPSGNRSAEFAKGSARIEHPDGKHSHADGSTGTFSDKNCPMCSKGK